MSLYQRRGDRGRRRTRAVKTRSASQYLVSSEEVEVPFACSALWRVIGASLYVIATSVTLALYRRTVGHDWKGSMNVISSLYQIDEQ